MSFLQIVGITLAVTAVSLGNYLCGLYRFDPSYGGIGWRYASSLIDLLGLVTIMLLAWRSGR